MAPAPLAAVTTSNGATLVLSTPIEVPYPARRARPTATSRGQRVPAGQRAGREQASAGDGPGPGGLNKAAGGGRARRPVMAASFGG